MLFRQAWSHDLHQQPNPRGVFFSPPYILAVERTSRLVRLDPETGSSRWEVKIQNPWGKLAANATCAFYLNQYTRLQCVDLASGELFWERTLEGNYFNRPLAVTENRVFTLVNINDHIQSLFIDARSGEVIPSPLVEDVYPLSTVGPWGLILVDPEQQQLLLLDSVTAQLRARVPLLYEVGAIGQNCSIQQFSNGLIATNNDGRIYVLNPDSHSSWRHIGTHIDGIATFEPPILGSQLIFHDSAQQLCCYDLLTGQLVWSRSSFLGRRTDLLPATMISGGRIVVGGTSSGRLEVIDSEGKRIGAHKVGKRVATNLCQIAPDEVIFGTTGLIVRYQIQ
jgi:outer membrane protein assembly factor BamB